MNLDNKYLKAWLTFNQSPTEDVLLNQWTTYGNPTIGTANAFNGNALQLDGQSYIKLSGIELGGKDFYIDGWVYVDSSSPANARVISIVNPSNGYHLVSVRKNSNNANRLDFWSNGYADVSQDSGQTNVPSITSVGQRVHFKLIYRYTDKIFALCINDKTYVHRTSAPQYSRRSFDIYIGALPNGNQGLIGSIDELRIYDGTWFSYGGSNNLPTLDEYQQIEFTADVSRKVLNDARLWRYFNAGTADKLTVEGTTLENLSEDKSVTGTAFYQTARVKCFDISATPEVWMKFDLYHYSGTSRFRIYDDGNGSTANGFVLTQNSSTQVALWSWNGSANYSRKTFDGVLKANTLQTWILHMSSGTSGGLLELWCDGEFVGSWTGNVNNGEDFANIYLQTDDEKNLFSNVIISNKELTFGDGYQTFTADVERRTTKRIEFTADVERVLIAPIIVPFLMGDHFNHYIAEMTLSEDVTYKIVLPKKSKVYLHARSNGATVQMYSDTDNTGTVSNGVYAALDDCNMVYVKAVVSPQSIIKAFMHSLNETNLRGTEAVDEAVNYCSGGLFKTAEEVSNQLTREMTAAENAGTFDEFLRDRCGVILDNEDTGSATGADAGSGTIKTAESIVPEKIPVSDWVTPESNSTTTIKGLTVSFPFMDESMEYYDAKRFILTGLNSCWVEEALTLVEETFGLSFEDAGTTVKYIDVYFENWWADGTIAFVMPWTDDDGITWGLSMGFCMPICQYIDTTSADGKIDYGVTPHLDRVIAHELTHAVMAANIKYYQDLPQFIIEGAAELVHGIDDTRNLSNADEYSAGYLFFRFLMKQTMERASATAHLINLFISEGALDSDGHALTDNTRITFNADVFSKLFKPVTFYADVEILDVLYINFTADVMRSIIGKVKLYAVDNSEYFSDSSSGNELTPVVIPRMPLSDMPAAVNNTDDLQSIEITLSEQQISETVRFVSTFPVDILLTFWGQYLDYAFYMCVEQVTQKGILYTCDCYSNVDELLYTQINYSIAADYRHVNVDLKKKTFFVTTGHIETEEDVEEIKAAHASKHLEEIAERMGLKLYTSFNDFISDMSIEQENVTYEDLITSLFGWTSRLPHRMINCFIRNGILFAIERGQEPWILDLTNTNHTIPTITKTLVRTAWGSSPESKTYTLEHFHPGWDLYPPPPGTSADGKTSYSYRRVYPHGYCLTETETQNDDGSRHVVKYSYGTGTHGETVLTSETSIDYDADGNKVAEKKTIHDRLTPSQQFSRVDDEDGVALGSNVGSNLPGFYNEKITLRREKTTTEEITIKGNPLIDTSFPVVEDEKLEELTEEINWLNRRTQETVTMTIYEYPHVINFLDRIFFNGAIYFLVSNTAVTTPRIFNEQRVTFARWY